MGNEHGYDPEIGNGHTHGNDHGHDNQSDREHDSHDHHKHGHGHGHRHEHGLRSSREFLNASSLLKMAGLGPGRSFLDLGCGDGHFSIAASTIVGPNTPVFAIDAEPLGIEMVRNEAREMGIGNIRSEVMDAVKGLPDPPSPLGHQVILMSNVLHGFVANGEFESVMEHITAVQTGKGKVVIIEFKKEETEFGPPIGVRLGEEQVVELFKEHGYSLDQSFDAGPAHYMLTFIRD